MVLGFLKTYVVHFRRKPTKFVEKILKGIKIHTIRIDEKQRWQPGRKIHFATGVRTSNYNCFKEGTCVSVQEIEILGRRILIDKRELNETEVEDLAINDGFDSINDFWAWFEPYGSFIGRLIHWTNVRY